MERACLFAIGNETKGTTAGQVSAVKYTWKELGPACDFWRWGNRGIAVELRAAIHEKYQGVDSGTQTLGCGDFGAQD